MSYNINELPIKGKTLTEIIQEEASLIFICNDGKSYIQAHQQDCCECVTIEDICGDLKDLLYTPLIEAIEITSSEDLPDFKSPNEADYTNSGYADESFTWTFYRFSTIKGTVVIRWYGTSNGYYSEVVNFNERPL